MIVGFKDTVKLFGTAIMACCAVFVCTLFLNYNIDLAAIESEITTEAAAMYNAHISMGKVVSAITGGCLVITSVIMLIAYVKNYIDSRGKELGILKALGYSEFKIAKHFWVFGLPVLAGCAVGFIAAFLYLPAFYKLQNADGLFPQMAVSFHPLLTFLLAALPAVVFAVLAVLFARLKLKSPVLNLLSEKTKNKTKVGKKDENESPFLKSLSKSTLKSKKSLVFFVAFSAFCFSAMVQMSLSMKQLSSESFAWMILLIGLILSFTTLFLSLSSVTKGNNKTVAMMKVFGYENSVCSRAVFGAYRPIAYVGFVIGTAYQYALLKIMTTSVFSGIENMPLYKFNFSALAITLAAFVIAYELTLYFYSLRIRKTSLKSVMVN